MLMRWLWTDINISFERLGVPSSFIRSCIIRLLLFYVHSHTYSRIFIFIIVCDCACFSLHFGFLCVFFGSRTFDMECKRYSLYSIRASVCVYVCVCIVRCCLTESSLSLSKRRFFLNSKLMTFFQLRLSCKHTHTYIHIKIYTYNYVHAAEEKTQAEEIFVLRSEQRMLYRGIERKKHTRRIHIKRTNDRVRLRVKESVCANEISKQASKWKWESE